MPIRLSPIIGFRFHLNFRTHFCSIMSTSMKSIYHAHKDRALEKEIYYRKEGNPEKELHKNFIRSWAH